MLCCHGTSADNLESILRDGLKCETDKVWNVSCQEVYCWAENSVEIDDEEDVEYWMIQLAYESAQCAMAKAKDCRGVVIMFEVDEYELTEDNSCENMQAASSIKRDIHPNEFVKVLIGPDLGLIRGYFIGNMLHRPLNGLEFDETETAVGEVFQKMEFYPEDLLDSGLLEEIPLGKPTIAGAIV